MKKYLILIFAIAGVTFLLSGCVNLTQSMLSVSFVNDYSGSMPTTAISNMETAVKTFIGYMQSMDRGEYIAFGENVINESNGFVSPPVLLTKVGGAGVNPSGTALYDAIYQGLSDLSGQPAGNVKALIVMTDGGDNASTHTSSDVIGYAKSLKIPIFTIGLGSSINSTVLQNIATQTGGKYYYAPSSSDLLAIYNSLIKTVTGRIYLY
ncbi:vWA domain-containing protein [Athalassotoga saccharophila]|uniref:vWA domain-containing protein n=1 Tax=Athalassotoga saccharophila TaxID=1441386 RepID=UPI001379B12C|nr:vWA domain-containing protein [Athalassotoga saccharophila]BBJ27998.1 von Willebrand factor type A domain [Athalassotoga saccharophila]